MDVTAQLIGYPRIGPNRELKWALERAWSGRMDPDAFAARIAELRQAHLDEQREAIGSAVDDYFLYDEVLETALMLGIAPAEAGDLETDAFGVLTALARGTPEREAWEMTKWFDTNYHYVVPEIAAPVEGAAPAALARAARRRRRDVADPRPLQPREAQQARRWPGSGRDRELRRRRTVELGTRAALRRSASRSTSRASAWR